MKNRKTEKPTGKAWVAVVGHSPPTNVAQVQILAISAMSVTFNLLLTIINKKLSLSMIIKFKNLSLETKDLYLPSLIWWGKHWNEQRAKCARFDLSAVVLIGQPFFWFVFLHVKGVFVMFGMLYRKIARVLLPVNFFSLTTGYIPGVVVAH